MAVRATFKRAGVPCVVALSGFVLPVDTLLPAFRVAQVVRHATTDERRPAIGSAVALPVPLARRAFWQRGAVSAAASPVASAPVPCFQASAWREADQLFHRDPHWVGGDGASSVDLGNGRILWLFGDSWIDPSGQGTRQGASLVSNSVAIQTGTDPVDASIRFYWGRAADGSPAAFVPDDGEERHWFGNGVRVGDRLVLFLNRVHNVRDRPRLRVGGWAAWMVENPDADPSSGASVSFQRRAIRWVSSLGSQPCWAWANTCMPSEPRTPSSRTRFMSSAGRSRTFMRATC